MAQTRSSIEVLLFETDEELPILLREFIERRLTRAEILEIWGHLRKSCVPNRQVLWTGMPRDSAQAWADKHNMQTLITAMGPYMNPKNSLCPAKRKSHSGWIDYIHGASALFALRITQGESVLVLSHPPPDRFRPDGNSGFQCIEAPIITGQLGNNAVKRIYIVHPFSREMSNTVYEVWPTDLVSLWLHQFATPQKHIEWKRFKKRRIVRPLSGSRDDWFHKSSQAPALLEEPSTASTYGEELSDDKLLSECGLHTIRLS